MANKRINELQVRTPQTTDLMLIGDPTTGYSFKTTILDALNLGVPTTRTLTINGTTFDLSANRTWNVGTVTSVGLTMPSAFTVTSSPVTGSGNITVVGAGNTTQYIAGDGSLVSFPIAGQAGTLVREVRNVSGATITKGTVVYINGANLNLPTIAKAIANTDATSAQTFGVVQNDIANNSNGYVVAYGDLIDLDTSAYSAGSQLYLSSTVLGGVTSTKPYAPNHLVYIGVVTRSHPSQGRIEVRIQNGYELEELHNVAALNPSDNDILQYKSSTGLWTKTAGTTTNIAEGTNLYFTNARARAAISITTFGTGGAAIYDPSTGILNIPNYSSALSGYVPYTGASNSLNLGTNNILAQNYFIDGNGTDGGYLAIKQFNSSNSGQTGYTSLYALQQNSLYIRYSQTNGTQKNVELSSALLGTTVRQYLFPDKNGTFAMTNDIPSLSGYVQGSGTINYVPKFTASGTIGNSTIQEVSGNVGISVTPSAWRSGWRTMQIYNSSITSDGAQTFYGYNVYLASDDFRYINSDGATIYRQVGGQHIWSTAPSGTAGNVITFTQAMTLNASGNLGIGTPNPSYKLHVLSSANSYSDLLISAQSNNGNVTGGLTFGGIYNSDSLNFYSGGSFTTKMVLNPSGNVGIGVTPESWFSGYKVLQVNNFSVASYLNSSVYLGHNYYTNTLGNDIYRNNGFASNYAQFSGQHAWFTAPSGIAGNPITFTQAMTLNASGNLGIGTSSPIERLTSNGLIAITGSSVTSWYVGANNAGFIDYNLGETRIGSQSAIGSSSISFHTTSSGNTGIAERMRITSGGNVGIGTDNPSGRLHINSSTSHTFLYSTISGASPVAFDNSSGGLAIHVGGQRRMDITTSGNVLIGTSTNGASRLRVVGLPTSSAGLSSGDIWNDGGTLKIV